MLRMPKQTPSIPNEILWARLGDRSALSDELWLIAAQVGMLLGRSVDQLAEDRKVGNPPPFKKDGGSIRYRLGSVRDHMFGSPEFTTTTQAKITKDKHSLGAYSSLQVWSDTAAPDDLWPFLIRPNGDPVDFWESLTLGDQLGDNDQCGWLSRRDYSNSRKQQMQDTSFDWDNPDNYAEEYRYCFSDVLAERRRFLEFVDTVKKGGFGDLTASQIAAPPFDVISDTIHLKWIRELLNGSLETKQSLGAMAMAILTEAHQRKAEYWLIAEGIPYLMGLSPVIYTPMADVRRGEIAAFSKAATEATWQEVLPYKRGPNGEVAVKAVDLLRWAKQNGLPVDSNVERAINDQAIGSISSRRKPGRPNKNDSAEVLGKQWRKLAAELMKEKPNLSMGQLAAIIHKSEIGMRHQPASIRKQLAKSLMKKDGLI